MSQTGAVFVIGEYKKHIDLPSEATLVKNINEINLNIPSIVVVNQDINKTDRTLNDLHASKNAWMHRLYTLSTTPTSHTLSDGLYDFKKAFIEFEEHKERLKTIKKTEDLDPLLAWLGCDKNRELVPIKDIQNTSIYYYPLISAIYPSLAYPEKYILSLTRQDLLVRGELIDRVRNCNTCKSAHINFVESCTSCGSIDIKFKKSLHCFTCGNVDDEKKFKRKNKLECPNCLTQLRHIGVDYDRPLESLACNSCSVTFVEPDTSAICFSCGTKSDVSELVVNEFHKLKISFQGEYLVQYGRPMSAPTLSLNGKVESGYFVNLVDWVNRLAIRHKEKHLLLGLYIPNLDDYARKYGIGKVFDFVSELTERLNGLFRESDICCMFRNDVLLVLMPKTDLKHVNVVKDKVGSLSSKIEDSSFSLNVFTWQIPDHNLESDSPVWFESIVEEMYAVDQS